MAKLETIRVLLALVVSYGREVHHLDVKSACLNGEILKETYAKQPKGYEVLGKERCVYKLKKAFYGLKEAPQA